MDSLRFISSPNVASLTNGGNDWRSKHFIKNSYYPSSYPSKIWQHKRKPQTEYSYLRFGQPMLNQHYKCSGEGSTYQDCNEQYDAKVTSKAYSDSEADVSYAKRTLNFIKKLLGAFFMFTSPYAILTQTLGVISASLLAVENISDISPLFFIGVLQVAIVYFFVAVFLAGINQLTDLEIDKINKPYLPLASGQLSFTTGVIIVASSLALSLWLGWVMGSWPLIVGLLWCSGLSIAYSINVPFLRWKGKPLLAAMSICSSWALVLPISSFLHLQTFVFKRPLIFPRSLIFAVTFMSLYSAGIALCKDIPDVEGDARFGIYSFAARFGEKRVFQICVFLFEMAFGVAFLAGATSPSLWIKIVTTLGHSILASVLWYQAKTTNLSSKSSITSFYFLTWKLLCAEYFLMPLLR